MLLVGSLLAVTLHAFDEMSVVTILPVISAELGGRSLYGAVFFAYLLASLIGLVVGGGQAARRGPASAFALGLASFALGLVFGAVAPTMEALVAGRAMQGFGGGVLSSTVLVVVNRGFGPDERPRVMALNATAWVVPALVAPAAAGALADFASWRWVFGGLLPLVAIAGLFGIPAMRNLAAGRPVSGFRDELVDGLRLALGLGVALGALARPLGAIELGAMLAGCVLALPALRRVMPTGGLRTRGDLASAIVTKGLLVFAFFGTEAFVPLALIEIHGVSATYAGLALTGAALSWTAGAHIQARLAHRVSARSLAGLGAAGIAAGIALMHALLAPATVPALAFVAWTLAGLGMGVAYNTVTVSAMAATPEGEEGSTSTALGVTDALAISLSTGIGGAWIAAADRASAPLDDPLVPIWTLTAVIAAVAIVSAVRLSPVAVKPGSPA